MSDHREESTEGHARIDVADAEFMEDSMWGRPEGAVVATARGRGQRGRRGRGGIQALGGHQQQKLQSNVRSEVNAAEGEAASARARECNNLVGSEDKGDMAAGDMQCMGQLRWLNSSTTTTELLVQGTEVKGLRFQVRKANQSGVN